MHWSDHYNRAKLFLTKGRPSLCLKYIDQYLGNHDSHFVNVLRGEAMWRCGGWAQLADLDVAMYPVGTGSTGQEQTMFPPHWVPSVKDEKRVRARLLCLRGEGRLRMNAENGEAFPNAASDFTAAFELVPKSMSACQRLFCEPLAVLSPVERQHYNTALHESFTIEQQLCQLFDREQYGRVVGLVEERWGGTWPPDRVISVYANSLLFCQNKLKLYTLAQDLINHRPDSAMTWYTVGLHYCGQGKEEEMRRYWLKGISKEDDSVPCWIGLGHSYSQAGDHDLAVNAYMAAAHHYAVGSAWPRLFLASEYVRCRRTGLAEPILASISGWWGSEGDCQVYLNEVAVCKAQSRDYRAALSAINRAIDSTSSTSSSTASTMLKSLLINRLHITLASLTDQQQQQQTARSTLALAHSTALHLHSLHPADPKIKKIRAFTAELCYRMSPKNNHEQLGQAVSFYEDYCEAVKGGDRWAVEQLARLRAVSSSSTVGEKGKNFDLTRYLQPAATTSGELEAEMDTEMELDESF
jgi:tetratricopeptide (TPR) repeat protein